MADDRDPVAAAAYVKKWAPTAGYNLDAFGEAARLADDAGVNRSTVNRLLNAIRVPDAAALYRISSAIGRAPIELLVESGTLPATYLDQQPRTRVASRPVTADDLADSWGATTPEERALVQNAYEIGRQMLQRHQQDGRQDTGS